MKKILVTGGAGFIGSHLCTKLINENCFVFCLDNFFTGDKRNIANLLNSPNFQLIEHDIIEPLNFKIKVDEIYNLACPASPVHYQYDPIKTLKTSVIGVLNMLELAKENNAKILQASTSEIYGNPEMHPQKEIYWGNVNPVGIRSCYDEGKRCAETLMSDYRRQYGLNTKIIRIFNTYGENMAIDDGRVVSNFIVQALKNEDITIYGTGQQTRSFCYVEDLIDGMTKMMNTCYEFEGPVNLGNPAERTISELAKIITELVGSSSNIVYKQLPADDPVKRKPDISLATEKLDWSPKIDIEEGLLRTIYYFRKVLEKAE